MKSVLRIGALSGLAAGAAIAAFLATAGRAPIHDALAIEASRPNDHGGAVHDDMFSRGVQEVGGAIGLLLYGIALGVIFAIVLASAARHLPARSSLAASLQLGAIGFVTVVVVPFVKYPGNPPAVGDPDTIDERTVQYFSALAASIVLTVLVLVVARRMRDRAGRRGERSLRFGPVGRAWALGAIYSVGLLAIFWGLPANPDVIEVPAQLIWRFRIASIGGLAAGWAMLSLTAGTLFASLEQRSTASLPDHDAHAPS